jgi:hypothetical protein
MEQEKKLLWENRAFLTHMPQALPKVLKSVNWNNFVHAQDMYTLMYDWCELKPAQVPHASSSLLVLALVAVAAYRHSSLLYCSTTAREWLCSKQALTLQAQVLYLLSSAFLDPIIREFAVERLKLMTDGQLLQFIPQLTQALKVGGSWNKCENYPSLFSHNLAHASYLLLVMPSGGALPLQPAGGLSGGPFAPQSPSFGTQLFLGP